VARGGVADLGEVVALLGHRDHRGVEVGPAHAAALEHAAGAARRALDVAAAQRDDVEVAERAQPVVAAALGVRERAADLRRHVAAELRRSRDRLGLEHDRPRRSRALELHSGRRPPCASRT
jgi:hypothetical protein